MTSVKQLAVSLCVVEAEEEEEEEDEEEGKEGEEEERSILVLHCSS